MYFKQFGKTWQLPNFSYQKSLHPIVLYIQYTVSNLSFIMIQQSYIPEQSECNCLHLYNIGIKQKLLVSRFNYRFLNIQENILQCKEAIAFTVLKKTAEYKFLAHTDIKLGLKPTMPSLVNYRMHLQNHDKKAWLLPIFVGYRIAATKPENPDDNHVFLRILGDQTI